MRYYNGHVFIDDGLYDERVNTDLFLFEVSFLSAQILIFRSIGLNDLDGLDEEMETIDPSTRRLYHNSPISLDKTLNLLQVAREKHRMTDACFECLLRLLSLGGILPRENSLPTTIRTFRKMVNIKSSIRAIEENRDFVIFDFIGQLKAIVTSIFPFLSRLIF